MTTSARLSEIDRGYIGQVLLKRGFKDWFLYMFNFIEQRQFIKEPIHDDLFEAFISAHNRDELRLNINIPPRSAKTTLAKYFVVYSLTLNPRCNFIYTSYSQLLLGDIARDIMTLLEHPIYKAMYPSTFKIEDKEEKPINEFWREYLMATTGKNTYSTKKITMAEGGELLFASIGSSITGMDCGVRGAKEFAKSYCCRLG